MWTRSVNVTNTSKPAYPWFETQLPIGEENLLEVQADIPGKKMTVNGTEIETPAYTYNSSYPSQNFALFARNMVTTTTGTSTAAGSNRANMKLYWFRATENGSPVVDLVPCINPEGKAGLYDLVTNVFYGPTLSTAFEPGPNV